MTDDEQAPEPAVVAAGVSGGSGTLSGPAPLAAGLPSYQLVAQSQQRTDVDRTLAAAKTAAVLMWKHPAAEALRAMADDGPARQRAVGALRAATLDHEPPNECSMCIRMLSGRR